MMSTIQISKETKELISSFGKKEDTYETIIKKMYELASKQFLRDFLMNEENCIPVKEALEEAKKKWPE